VPVVIDSGIWISALKFGGLPHEVLRTAFAGDRIVCCAPVRAEVIRIMTTKFGWLSEDTTIAMNRFMETETDAPLTGATKGICRDPNDDMVLDCALVNEAAYIVSSDHDLLVMKIYSGISILTAREYLDKFGYLV
jgi:putative PIN family toxin of toxin-antitoxin system